MLATFLGITGALLFGGADFVGGLAAKRIRPLVVTALSASCGLIVLFALYPFLSGVWSLSAVTWGVLSGITSTIALSLLYACLALGPMSILSPLTAVISAIVPLVFGLINGEKLSTFGYLGLALALGAAVLVGFVPEKGAVRPTIRGLSMALGSGVLLGAFLIMMHQTPEDSGVIPLMMNRATIATTLFFSIGILHLFATKKGAQTDKTVRTLLRKYRVALLCTLACGVVDVLGNVLLIAGLHLGELSVMSVLAALYPAGTVILAAIVLRERIAPVQIIGLLLAFVAVWLLASA